MSISRHCAELTQHVTRKDMSMGNLSERFTAVSILSLAGHFLQQFVRNHQFRSAIVYIKARVVFGGPLPLQDRRKSTAAATIRKVLLDGRIEKTMCSHSISSHTKRGLYSAVPQR